MSRPELSQLGAYWLEELRLQNWRVTFEYVRDLCASDGSPVHGLCFRERDSKTAHIQVRDPETPIPGAVYRSPEETVVHEVSHLHFAPFDITKPAEVTAEENAVWSFSEAMLRHAGSPRAQMIARAMAARAIVPATRRTRMDLAMLIVALKSAAAAEDPKAALEALISQLESGSGGAPPPAEPPPPSEMPPAQRPAADSAPRLAPAQRPQTLTAADVRAMVATGVDGARRDELLEREGTVLGEEDLRYARTQPYETVRRMIALAGGTGQPPRPASQAAPRRQSPSRGPGGAAPTAPASTELAEVDRRMGLSAPTAQAIGRDPVTGRLMISNIAPNQVRRAGE